MLLLEKILDSGVSFSVVKERPVDKERLAVEGPADQVAKHRSTIKHYRRDVIEILTGDCLEGVGQCPGCQLNLIGLRTFDGYVNRFCPVCGGWQTCTRETGPTGITPGRIPVSATNVTAPTAPKNQTSLFT